MTDLREHEEVLSRVLRRLEGRTSFAEVLAQQTQGESVGMDSKSRRASTYPRLAGAVIRAWAGSHWVEAAASGFDRASLDGAAEAIERALAPRGPVHPPPGEASTTVGNSTALPPRPMREMGLERELEYVRDLFRWASAVPGIRNVSADVTWWDDERFYLNSAGARCFQTLPRVRGGCTAVAVENGRAEFDYTSVGAIGGQEVLEGLTEARIRELAVGAVALLAAKPPPTGLMNVVLDHGTTGAFAHESFGHGTEADQFVRDRSYLKPILGQTVGPESITIVDDGSIPGGWGSVRYDDEGHPGEKTTLVDRGRFVGALHDRDSAAVLGARATGNTRRSNFLSRAFVRMTNTYVEPQDWTLEELLEEAGEGVLLERLSSGMEDPLGGQMQLKVRKGRRIEHGRLTDLVSSMALSGSVLSFLRDVRGVGGPEDFEIEPGFCGKGHGDYLPAGDGGPYLLSRAVVGPA
jgi:TldD protein